MIHVPVKKNQQQLYLERIRTKEAYDRNVVIKKNRNLVT
jgi:hypothetical protein